MGCAASKTPAARECFSIVCSFSVRLELMIRCESLCLLIGGRLNEFMDGWMDGWMDE